MTVPKEIIYWAKSDNTPKWHLIIGGSSVTRAIPLCRGIPGALNAKVRRLAFSPPPKEEVCTRCLKKMQNWMPK